MLGEFSTQNSRGWWPEVSPDSSSTATTGDDDSTSQAHTISIAVEATTVGIAEFHAFVGMNTETQERVAVVSRSAPMRLTSSSQWFPIPKDLDVSEVAVLLASYLPALRILRHGTPSTGLRRRRVLIAYDVATPLTTALARLAKIELGCREVQTSRPTSSAAPFDLVIDFGGHWQTEIPRPQKTRVICCRTLHSAWDDLVERSKLTFTPYASLYDMNTASLVAPPRPNEMQHLLALLQCRRIRPEIQQYVSLAELSYLPHRPTSGVVVCEPWKE